ncbi:MAG: glycosyltransferase [Bacteroidota bacterium]
MKIIHLISSLTRGGRERQLATIIANTNWEQYPSQLLYFNKRKNSYIDEYGLTRVSTQVKSKGKWKRLVELNHILKKEQPDVVLTWGNGESVSILLLKPFHKFHFINGSVRHGIRSRKFSHYFRTLVLHLSQHVLANSKAGLKANNLRRGIVLYNGVDEKFLKPLPDRVKTRKELTGVPDTIPIMISVANLVPYKDYFTILKALKQIKEAGQAFYYLILGDGSMRSEIEATIQKYDLKDNIRIVGNVENVSDYLKISDIFVHSSKGEGCSNAILEAMAAGLPVVASDTGGTSEITNSQNSILFQFKNVEELKNSILYYLQNNQARNEAGKQSKKIVYERFSIQRMMEDYYQILNAVSKS